MNRRKIEHSRICNFCNVDVHRASYAKHFKNWEASREFKTG